MKKPKPSPPITLPGGLVTAADSSVEMIIRFRTREEYRRWLALVDVQGEWIVIRVGWTVTSWSEDMPGVVVLRNVVKRR